MRWMLVVMAMALAGCGGADDGEVFGSDAGATSAAAGTTTATSPTGFPSGTATCDENKRARFDVPGRKAHDLRGHYTVVETVPKAGSAPVRYVSEGSYVDGAVLLDPCHDVGNEVEFNGY